MTQSNLFDIGSAGTAGSEEEVQGDDETIFSFFENVIQFISVKFAFDTSDMDSKIKQRCFSLPAQHCDAGTSSIESNFDNNGEGSLIVGEINRFIDRCGYSNSNSHSTFHANLYKCSEAIPEVCFFVCFLLFFE